MPVTIIGDICRGDEQIADMKCARDSSQAMHDASRELINALKLRIRVLQSSIDKEWANQPR